MAELPDKIAFFTDARAWGGAEVYLSQLLGVVRAAGATPHIFCADRREIDAWVEDLESQGYSVVRYRPTKEFNPLGYFVARRLLNSYELVHLNKTHPRNCLPAVVAARASGARVVVATEHLALPPDSHFPLGRQIITSLVRCTNRLLDRTVAVSDLSRRMLMENYGVPPDRIVAIRNGIDVSRFDVEVDVAAVRRELGLAEEDRVAVLVGRFAARKGHDCALKAIAAIRHRVPRLRAVFAGDGELEAELKAEAEQLGVSDLVVFAGFRRDIPRVLASSDVLMLPSEDECLPLVILEAMASSLPVIATDVGGISEAVEDGATGILVRPGDAAGLGRALESILRDRELAGEMGRAGRRKVVREFGVEACAEAVLKLYRELLREKGR